MKDMLLSLNQYFSQVPGQLRPRRWTVIGLASLFTVFFTFGAVTRFEMDVTMDAFFSDEDPVTQALDDFRRQFGSDDGLFIVYEAKDGDVFSHQSLTLLRELTETFDNAEDLITLDEKNQPLDHIRRVQSLTNVNIQYNEGETLRSDKLVPPIIPVNESELDEIRRLADSQKNLKLFMFSLDHRFGAISIQTDFGAIPKSESQVMADVDLSSSDVMDAVLLEDDFDAAFVDFEVEIDASALVNEVEFEDTESTV